MGPLKQLSCGVDAHFGWKGGRPCAVNKYVTERSEETHENRNDEIGDRVGRPGAKARPQETSVPMPSFPRVSMPFRMRKWIHVEPGEYDQVFFEVTKKMTRLLRHDLSLLGGLGAVEFKSLAPIFASKFAFPPLLDCFLACVILLLDCRLV